MRSLYLVSAATALFIGSAVAVSEELAFSTKAAFREVSHGRKRLRRVRREALEIHNKEVNVKHGAAKISAIEEKEDKTFWKRLLDEEMSMNTRAPTFAPAPTEPAPSTPAPTEPAPSAPAPTEPAPSAPAPSAPAPSAPAPTVPAPTPTRPVNNCPISIEIDCVSVDGSQSCTDISPPESGEGDGCTVEVEYSYAMTNTQDTTERIYSLIITRGGETEDITSTFPVTDLAPDESTVILQNAEVNICNGNNPFDTTATFTTGPPSDVQINIACESDDGDECQSLPQAETPDECIIDITYTYTVTNTGNVDANIILFTRTRNGEFRDLIDLLETTSLLTGDSTQVQETEEIDRCVQQSFATNTVVAQVPNADLLCDAIGFYP